MIPLLEISSDRGNVVCDNCHCNSMKKQLYDILDNSWHACLDGYATSVLLTIPAIIKIIS